MSQGCDKIKRNKKYCHMIGLVDISIELYSVIRSLLQGDSESQMNQGL